MRRLLVASLATMAVAAASPSVASAQYWDFQGWLYDPPTIPFEAGQTNPNTGGYWKIRLSRSNCEAKVMLRFRSTGNVVQFQDPNLSCSDSDFTVRYHTGVYDASAARNTEAGSGIVWVNVRVAENT
jgi:hypothetical protein